MGRITISLLRKRAEHNDMELATLEEISLHQENLERIEMLDRACPHLKILYLQNNIISVIENLNRLKSLVYINLALNNIQIIQNLESVESLEKLDLTINFIFNVKDVDRLKANQHLRELYLTGNPCTTYNGYREYVVTALPSLQLLDGKEVLKSERIKARQDLPELMDEINEGIEENTPDEIIITSGSLDDEDEKFDPNNFKEDDTQSLVSCPSWVVVFVAVFFFPHHRKYAHDFHQSSSFGECREYWQEEVEHTPRSRFEMHKKQEAMQLAEDLKKNPPKPKKKKKMFKDDGTPLNMNEGEWNFQLEGQDIYSANLVLDFPCYKYVDTSQIDLDVQPTYVRITIKDHVFQLRLPEEVHPDKGNAQRSQITGHLIVTMPKVNPPRVKKPAKKPEEVSHDNQPKTEKLEVSPVLAPDYKNILKVADGKPSSNTTIEQSSLFGAYSGIRNMAKHVRENDADFVDDDDVPPLE
eukprot:m.12409 g.12409  ORF g.12409 m.12409 type:complete len:470 (+) comp3995_c0_seq2:274-1683(+)